MDGVDVNSSCAVHTNIVQSQCFRFISSKFQILIFKQMQMDFYSLQNFCTSLKYFCITFQNLIFM